MEKVITVQLKSFGDLLDFAQKSSKVLGKVECIQENWIVNGKSSLGIASLNIKKPMNVKFTDCSDAEITQYDKWKVNEL